jgi:membrane protein
VKLADVVARLLLEAWPDEVAGPLATEIHHVLTTPHGGLVTIGGGFALYFSSSGIESRRIGLNRAYELRERRSFWVLRLHGHAGVDAGPGLSAVAAGEPAALSAAAGPAVSWFSTSRRAAARHQ